MELQIFRHLWGFDEPWDTLFARINATELYYGIEAPLPAAADQAAFEAALRANHFAYIAQIFTSGDDVAAHIDSFRRQLQAAQTLEPVLVNCHSGRDAWSWAEAEQFFEAALAIETELGLPVAHETHRGRILYNPWITRDLLTTFPELHLCADWSHWVCVCERLLTTELDIIKRCARQTRHIHGRIGYEQGPQVPDPRAQEYEQHRQAHEAWWYLVWQAQANAGQTISTFTPEFGPPRYLPTLPHTDVPVADLWNICNWQAHRQLERFARLQLDVSDLLKGRLN